MAEDIKVIKKGHECRLGYAMTKGTIVVCGCGKQYISRKRQGRHNAKWRRVMFPRPVPPEVPKPQQKKENGFEE